VKDAIDVSKGDSPRLSGPVLDMYNQMGGSLVTAAFVIPESGRNEISQTPVSGAPFSLKPFGDVDLVGFAWSKDAQSTTFRVNAHFTKVSSVTDAKDTVSGAILTYKGMSVSSDVKDMLGKVEVTVNGANLNLTLKATLLQLAKFSSSLD
jgi:hypothetical protein